jgi:glycosyltransferase involved in cell wall biosynthesis
MQLDTTTDAVSRTVAPVDSSDAGGEAPVARENAARVGFIMSTEVGLRTQYLNWKACLTPDLGVRPEWIVIDWWKDGGFIERTPFLSPNLKASVRAEIQLREGLRRGPFDALFVAQERLFHGSNHYLLRQPFFITADVTAMQLAEFGSLYNKMPRGPAPYEEHKHRERQERFQRACGLFPWSRWAADSMVNDYGAEPNAIHVIPPGVDLDKWTVAGRATRDKLDGTVEILFVGGDFYRKGGDLLLDWASRTTRRGWRLHMVTRDLVAPTHADVRVYNRLHPNDAALMNLYAEADIFALPTRGDCYSIASIEAMAAGLPVVLSRTGGTGDIIADGTTGFLIEPGDGAALSERLDILIDNADRRVSMGVAARAEAERRFDARANIRRTVSIMLGHLG